MMNLFGHSARSEMCVLYLVDALTCFFAVYMLLVLGGPQASTAENREALAFAAVLAFSSGPVFIAGGLYEPAAWSQARRLAISSVVAALLLLPLALLTLTVLHPPSLEGGAWRGLWRVLLASVAAVAVTRFAFAALNRAGLFTRRVALLQDGPNAIRSEKTARGEALPGSLEIAFVAPLGTPSMADLPDWLRAQRIWALVAAQSVVVPEALRQRCEARGVRVFEDAEFSEERFRRVDIDALPRDWLHAAGAMNESLLEAGLRRLLDVAVSLLLLLLTLPLLLLTAFAIKLDSPGPVFYRQERIGRGGKAFMLFKFRSMTVDAEANGAPRWAAREDPRTTRVGRLIRLTRIDEIPQVLNVLRGDMAVVGPRPERPAFVEQLGRLIPRYDDRACVKPGITGWAQINYPYGASVEDARHKLSYDLYYVRRRSVFLDLLILIKTVRVVVFQEGSR